MKRTESCEQEPDFKIATTHPFLVRCGELSIEEEVLSKWLKQDYLYAFVGYIKVCPFSSLYPDPDSYP